MSGATPPVGDRPIAVVPGAMRCGTTALARTLAAHPDVVLPRQKEVHFFDVHWDRGWGWYRDQFAGEGRTWLDATPTYMWWEPARDRMLAHLPQARYVVLVRDPVDRAWSHYWYMRSRGREDLEFADAVEAEPERLRGADLEVARTVSYLARGRYAPQVSALIDAAGRDAVHVVGFAELVGDHDRVVSEVLDHLGLAPVPLERATETNTAVPWRSVRLHRALRGAPARVRRPLERWNRASDRSHPPLDPDFHRRLSERFADDRRELAALLGHDPLAAR